MRTIVELPEQQIEGLAKLEQRNRRSRASLIREAVSEYLSRHEADIDDEAFGLWRQRGVGGLEYQQKVRSEWE